MLAESRDRRSDVEAYAKRLRSEGRDMASTTALGRALEILGVHLDHLVHPAQVDRDAAFERRHMAFQRCADAEGNDRRIVLVGELDGQMRCDRIGELAVVIDLRHRRDDLGPHDRRRDRGGLRP